eukprot:6691195-Lingulodinium_polyedra.AAC.1
MPRRSATAQPRARASSTAGMTRRLTARRRCVATTSTRLLRAPRRGTRARAGARARGGRELERVRERLRERQPGREAV